MIFDFTIRLCFSLSFKQSKKIKTGHRRGKNLKGATKLKKIIWIVLIVLKGKLKLRNRSTNYIHHLSLSRPVTLENTVSCVYLR